MKNLVDKIQNNKSTIIKCAVAVLLYIPIAIAIELLIGVATTQDTSNAYIKLLVYVVAACAYITFLIRKNIYKYAHVYIFAIIVLCGVVQIVGTPPVVGISWDDEIHYKKAAYLSWGANGNIAPADEELVRHYQSVIYERKEYNSEGRDAWVAYIDQYHEDNSELIQNSFKFTKECVAYIPSAIGLAIGHLFGMTFTHTFMLGKFFNLLSYALIVSLAIKQLDRGKLLMAVIAMFPTNIFLASSYSYDWWLTCLVMLAYALFLKEIQSGRKITTKRLLVILGIMVLALLPKAVYFLLIAPMFFFKDDRYENPKVCRYMIIGAAVILLLSFLIPLLIGGGGGDMRGGSDVNGTEQIKFVLTHPSAYVGVLRRFLFSYLSPDTAGDYMTFYAYMGRGSFNTMTLPLLAAACALDNNAKPMDKKENIWVTAVGFLAVAGSILLVVTAMYVSFTPVGFGTVNGCQPRYLAPIIFPGLYLLTRMNIDVSKKIRENAFLISVFALAFVYLYNMFELSITKL